MDEEYEHEHEHEHSAIIKATKIFNATLLFAHNFYDTIIFTSVLLLNTIENNNCLCLCDFTNKHELDETRWPNGTDAMGDNSDNREIEKESKRARWKWKCV